MARELRRREFTSIVYGSSFYGGGGGGCSEEGLALIEAMYQEDAVRRFRRPCCGGSVCAVKR